MFMRHIQHEKPLEKGTIFSKKYRGFVSMNYILKVFAPKVESTVMVKCIVLPNIPAFKPSLHWGYIRQQGLHNLPPLPPPPTTYI